MEITDFRGPHFVHFVQLCTIRLQRQYICLYTSLVPLSFNCLLIKFEWKKHTSLHLISTLNNIRIDTVLFNIIFHKPSMKRIHVLWEEPLYLIVYHEPMQIYPVGCTVPGSLAWLYSGWRRYTIIVATLHSAWPVDLCTVLSSFVFARSIRFGIGAILTWKFLYSVTNEKHVYF